MPDGSMWDLDYKIDNIVPTFASTFPSEKKGCFIIYMIYELNGSGSRPRD